MKQFVTALFMLVLFFSNQPFARAAAEPVHFSRLIPFLPDKVDGFVPEKAVGTTNTMMGMKTTEVSRLYRKDTPEGEPSVTVTVKNTDGTGNTIFIYSQSLLPDFSNESTDGYEKSYVLDGFRAMERYTAESKNGSLSVFVAGRYLVVVEISGLESQTMQEWWRKIDVQKLAALSAP